MRKLVLIVALVIIFVVPASAHELIGTYEQNTTTYHADFVGHNTEYNVDVNFGTRDLQLIVGTVNRTETFVANEYIESRPAIWGTAGSSGTYTGDILIGLYDPVVGGTYDAEWYDGADGFRINVDYYWSTGVTGKEVIRLDNIGHQIVPATNNQALVVKQGEHDYYPTGAYLPGQIATSSGWAYGSITLVYSGANIHTPVADFNGTPLSGKAPLWVQLTSNSTGGQLSYNWSVTGPGSAALTAPTGSGTMAYFTVAGNYTVIHGVSNIVGSDIETKTDYIWIYDDNSTATTQYGVLDYVTGYEIHDATINLQDIENSSWSNSTTPNNGFWSITTLLNNHINAYASAAGFESNDRLNDPAWDGMTYWIMLHPVNWTNSTPGNVTLFVNVWDAVTLDRINGAAVTIATPTFTKGLYTNSAGVAQFQVPNQTSVLVDVKALGQGYKGAVKTVNTGDGSGGDAAVEVTFLLVKNAVTPTPAVTTLPGGGTPTATTTADPYDSMDPAEKQSYMAELLMGYGPDLVLFFIMLTLMGGVKMMTK